jgi:hypothetical protein
VTPTLFGALIVAALLLAGIGAWLLFRDTPTPKRPRRRRPSRDPHDQPIVPDDEQPPGNDWEDFR